MASGQIDSELYVLPTSSASKEPLERGDFRAKRAASIYSGNFAVVVFWGGFCQVPGPKEGVVVKRAQASSSSSL